MFGQVMVNVPKNFQDFDDDDPKVKRRLSRWTYWNNLKILKAEFEEKTGSKDHFEYLVWIENTYGFKPIETSDGMMTDDCDIVDEKKYLVYILKYGQ